MPGWKALSDELDPDVRAFAERLRRLIDRSGLGVTAVAERTGHDRSLWDACLDGRRPVPRTALAGLAEVTGTDAGDLAADWERAERAWARNRHPDEARDSGRAGGAGGSGGASAAGGSDGSDGSDGSSASGGSGGASAASAAGGSDESDESDESGGSDGASAAGGAAGVEGGDAADGPRDDRTMQIRRLEPAPTPSPSPSPSPTPTSDSAPPSRPRRTLLLYVTAGLGALLVVTAAVLLVDLGGTGDGTDDRATAPPSPTAPTAAPSTDLPAGVKCSGAGCTGRDPEAMGCGGPLATTVARARSGTVLVEVRHSETCAAAWARISGAAPGETVTVKVAGATRRASVPAPADTDAYTPMLAVTAAADATACATLADGTETCTAN